MSYDIDFRGRLYGTDKYVSVGDCTANITWNVGEMIRKATGLEWKNGENNGLVKDIIPYIEKGLEELRLHPSKYKKYESPNGWGTIDGCIEFFVKIIRDWKLLLLDDEELADYVYFWIC